MTVAEVVIVAVTAAAPGLLAWVLIVVMRRRQPPSVTQGAWYADPTGRHELRWFDGAVWTAHVADQGATSLDPLA